MGVVGSRDVKVAAANIKDSVIINKESTVGVLDRAVSRQDSIVGLNHRCRDTRSWVNSEFELRLLAVIGRQAFEEKCTKT
jgi:hypothetical protein